MPGSSFGCGPAGGALASGPVAGQGEDGGEQFPQRVICAGGPVPAVPAAGAGGDVGADEGEHAGERDPVRAGAGGCGGVEHPGFG